MHYPNESFDSEGKYIGKHSRRATDKMANGDGKLSWDTALKIMQILIIPTFGGVVVILAMMYGMGTRLAVLESKGPAVDTGMIQRMAVFEERQNRNTSAITNMEAELQHHREISTYDPGGVTRRIQREH
jgi:hypothetical protein